MNGGDNLKANNLISIRNLSVDYLAGKSSIHAVRHLDLDIGVGETLGFVGETGAGKTTTALSIMGILPEVTARIRSGEILLEGDDLLKKSKKEMRGIRGKDISMIFQDPMTSLDPVMTVGKQIEEMIKLHMNLPKKRIREASIAMLESVGIRSERYDNYPHEFSGGMKQRVMIAIALSCYPKLLIADEPTTALDVTIQAQVIELMKKLRSEYNTSMLLITHDLGIVAEICDKVAIMYAGSVVEYGTANDIFNNHKHPYTQALFDSIPDIESEQSKLNVISGILPDPTNLPSGCVFHPRCNIACETCKQISPEKILLSKSHYVYCLRAKEAFI